MLIAFTHAFKAFLPEIAAYSQFFEQYGIKTMVANLREIATVQADVEWRFMGMQTGRNKAPVLIHEYASASLPPFRNAKDYIKRKFTVKPDFRLFLNEYVRQQLSFGDKVPHGFRDMGVQPGLLQQDNNGKKTYDFIYVGSVSKDMEPGKLLDCFTRGEMREKSLLILSKDYEPLKNKYREFANIIFAGPVPQQEVSNYINQSSFAINYKPDVAPHHQQTSTKFLEYAAGRIPILTTDFAWMRNFQQRYGGQYFYLSGNLSNLDWEQINTFQYSFPDLSEWTWEKQIMKSGVLAFLKEKFEKE